MNNQPITPKCLARQAGFLYLLLIPLGIFGIMYIPMNFIVQGDVTTTVENIRTNITLFYLAIVSALLIQLVNLAVALKLYALLKVVHKSMAIVMVLFIIVAMPIAMLNELNFIAVAYLIEHNLYPPYELNKTVQILLYIHESGIQLAGIFWGLWLFPMGYLIIKSNFIPKFIGILLIIGCFGYLVESFSYFLPMESLLWSNYTFFGEIAIIFWLLIKGVDEKHYQKLQNS